MIHNVVKYNKKELIKCFGRPFRRWWYWFEMKDGSNRAFYVRDNNFYLSYDKIIWLEAVKFLEMIGDDWNI